MDISIDFSTLWVCRTAWQRQTNNLPAVLVEQDKHRFDISLYELEGAIVHTNGLEYVLFVSELLTRSRCLTIRTIIVVDPRGRVGPRSIGVPARELAFLFF